MAKFENKDVESIIRKVQTSTKYDFLNEIDAFSMLHKETLALLHEMAKAAKGKVLEIGPYMGGSTIAMAGKSEGMTGKIITVEMGGSHPDHPHLPTSDIVKDLTANIKKYGVEDNVILLQGLSTVPHILRGVEKNAGEDGIGLLFIDADGNIKRDLEVYARYLSDDCLLCFDDYISDAAPEKQVGTKFWVDVLVQQNAVEEFGVYPWGTWFGKIADKKKMIEVLADPDVELIETETSKTSVPAAAATAASVDDDDLRFSFGSNWADYIEKNFSEEKIEISKRALLKMLKLDDLKGKRFIDIGCGSGLHSLAAYRAGAEEILSFDYDNDSVTTSKKIRAMEGNPENWKIEQGSVLDPAYVESLGKFDIVYSWGVLHHTGDMWNAIKNSFLPVRPDSDYYIALYASEMYVDPTEDYWLKVKKQYNEAGELGRYFILRKHLFLHHIWPALKRGQNPLTVMREYNTRGMEFWIDLKDWIGGYPMEFSSYPDVKKFVEENTELTLTNLSMGHGCTEFVFANKSEPRWKKQISNRKFVELAQPFVHVGGKMWRADSNLDESMADGNQAPRNSNLMVYEDDHMMGMWHSTHDYITRFGGGRFSHWGSHIFFSTTDDSDPNTNGREYIYCL